jgi:hypothetical protein
MATKKKKNPAAVALGELGGKIGGKARVKKGLAMLTPERKTEIALAGVEGRKRARRAEARTKKAAAKKQAST